MRIYTHCAALVQLDSASGFEQAVCAGAASDRNNQPVHVNTFILFARVIVDGASRFGGSDFGDLASEADIEPLSGELLFCFTGNHSIGTAKQRIHCLKNDDLGTKTPPHAAQFKPDNAGTDNAEAIGYRRKCKRAGRIKNGFVVY